MRPRDLAQQCADVLAQGLSRVSLVIPGGPPRGHRIRLDRTSRRKCPMGEVMNWQDDPPRTVASFDALDVLAWLAANGLVRVDARVRAEEGRGDGE